MNVARLNMSHGDHSSHKKTIDLVKEYNAQSDDNVIAIMLDTKVYWFLKILIQFFSFSVSDQQIFNKFKFDHFILVSVVKPIYDHLLLHNQFVNF